MSLASVPCIVNNLSLLAAVTALVQLPGLLLELTDKHVL